jgi:hypothetical protein
MKQLRLQSEELASLGSQDLVSRLRTLQQECTLLREAISFLRETNYGAQELLEAKQSV